MYILASHGNYAAATLHNCELITGKLSDFKIVSFEDPMGVEDVVKAYQDICEQVPKDESIMIITDIFNGTPANAALIFKQKYRFVRIFAGLSLSLILTLATGTEITDTLKQNRSFLKEIDANDPIEEVIISNKNKESNKNSKGKFYVRIDSRLIHGQVATMWAHELNLDRIMVVDDGIVKDNIQKLALRTARPAGVHLSILTSAGAAERIKKNLYADQRVLVLVKNPLMLKNLINFGVNFSEINVGNLSMTAEAKQVFKSVALTSEDEKIFRDFNSRGIKIFHQMVPSDSREDLIKRI